VALSARDAPRDRRCYTPADPLPRRLPRQALFGGEKKIRITQLEACTTCGGSGVAPGASVTTCSTCGGRGSVTQTVNTILGRMQQQSICPTCGGTGSVVEKYCGSCDGRGTSKRSKQLTVTIPPGVENGNRLRVRGEGDAGPKGGPSGDLYVFLSVARDPNFRREGMDLYSEVPVSYVDAILGTTLKVDTVDGNAVDVALPAGTQPGATLRLEGKGAPKLNNVNMRGSHFVKINVQIPKSLSPREKELVTQLRKL
jgi:molecular chaperone DnaJ